jgi:hypothetical protein
LKRHFEVVAEAVEGVCRERAGDSLDRMAAALVTAFLAAKMKDVKTSVALYSVSSDVDGVRMAQRMSKRLNQAIVDMLATAPEPLTQDLQLVAAMLQGAMAGVSRRLLESAAPEKQIETVRRELILLVSAYLQAGR